MTRAATTLDPEDSLRAALEITHPAISSAARVINDSDARVIAGRRYQPLRFEARLADDRAGRRPAAEISIDNVGREIVEWVQAAQLTRVGIAGIAVRVMLVTVGTDPTEQIAAPDYDVKMDVAEIAASATRITARLGFDPLLDRPAVALRHDPATSPGLF